MVLLGVAPGVVAQKAEVPELTGRVVDQADLLSPTTEGDLSAKLAAHEDATSNQVAVLTIPSLKGAPIERYGLRVARTWGLGQEEFDNGVLLLVARDDQKMRIEVGYGLEGDLPDVVASRIVRYEMRPAFRDGNFDRGVRAGVAAILESIEGTYEPPTASSSEGSSTLGRILFGLLFLLLPVFFALQALVSTGHERWFLFIFLLPFFFVGGFTSSGTTLGGLIGMAAYAVAFLVLSRVPEVNEWAETMEAAAEEDEQVQIGPFTVSPGSGGSSGGIGSGSSSGGGFSGGGGSFGGGGASGGW